MEASKTCDKANQKLNIANKCKCNKDYKCINGFCKVDRPLNSPLIQPQTVSIDNVKLDKYHLPPALLG
jgi:hypothetical protein